jgi:carboxypeptidase family protein/TonB-dependent receptor-like protein
MGGRVCAGMLFVYLSMGAVMLPAQVTSGTVSGTVTDRTGAVIPGATVAARNSETGITRTTRADAQGRYQIPQLGLGMYELTAEADGFQRVVRSGIEMTVGRQAAVDFTLQVGTVSETVTVTGEAPLLETTNATVADLVSEGQMRDLPLNGRSFTDLVTIQPGVITDMDIPQSTLKGGGRITMNGARPQQSLYLLDGVEIVDPINNTPPVSVLGQTLGVDTIREFTVLSNNYGSQFGRAIGGVVNAVTRSGTNAIHGSGFEFVRSQSLDAKNFFDVPDDPIPPFKRNQFGGTVGGPIVKDSTFFFGSYEGLRQSFGTTDFGSVLTNEARAGIITNCPVDPASPSGKRLVTCTKDQAVVTDTLPLGLFPAIKPFLGIIPLGTGLYMNDGAQEFRGSRTQTGRENYYMARIDQKASINDSIFGRMVLDSSSKELPDAQFAGDSKTHPSNNEWGTYRFVTMEWTRILSSSTLNTARVGFSRNTSGQCQCIDGQGRADINTFPGLSPVFQIVPGVPWGGSWGIPGVSIPGGHNGPGTSVTGAYLASPIKFASNTFTYLDSLRVSKGRHSLDIGVDIRRYQENANRTTWVPGLTSWFSPLKNFLTAAQSGYCVGAAADCQGINTLTVAHTLTSNNGFAIGDTYRGYRQTYFSWYAQDDIRLLSNLTLNIGVRWDKITAPTEVNQKQATLVDILRDTSYTQLGSKPLFKIRDILGGLGPRFGFAYSPDKRTSIRGGFGLFKEMPLFYTYSVSLFHPPQANRIIVKNIKTWPNPLQGVDPRTGTLQPTTIVYDYKYSYAMQWNFGIERQLGQSYVASASFIGTRGIDLGSVVNLVQPAVSVDGNGVPFTARNAPSINPTLDSSRTFCNCGDSWYNALQLRLQKRFSNGFEFSASHTWSKNIAQAVGLGVTGGESGSFGGNFQITTLWDYKKFDRGRADQDVPNNFTFNSSYELPIGKGKPFGANMGTVANAILGGWQVNGTFTKRAGLPKDITGPGYSTNSFCRCALRPNLKPGGNNNPVIGELDHWFDESQFTVVPTGYFGNVGKNTLSGPGLTKLDMSVFKKIAVGESKSLQFRAELFNLPNHPIFAGPNAAVFDTTGQLTANQGRITSTASPSRQIQLALKFEF